MKQKIIIAALVAAVLIGGIVLWHSVRQPRVKIVKAAKKRETRVAVPKPGRKARVAIVIDDFGYSMNNIEPLFSIKEPVTLSILPDLKYSKEIAQKAIERGYEVILHMPLEAHRKDVSEEADTIRSGMPEREIAAMLEKEIASVPGLSGVSNHMGSKSTEDIKLMTTIFRHLKKNRLYFFDSLTSEKSVCREAAESVGLRYARRDMFLDNTETVDYVEKQLTALERIALRRGSLIAICHDRKDTVTALTAMMRKMAKDGIEFVKLSEMEH